jgi:site-specific recombinase XerC
MLGHASLEITQLYTRVSINDLQAMHAEFHPRKSRVRMARSDALREVYLL